ncbi:MAG: hypothetical protein JWR57_945 [Mycetocola sp.]|nr:hypothetical protein [Mycetocola sp.]
MTELSQYSSHFFDADAVNNSWSNMYRYVPEGARVLDVGCSTGNFGAALEAMKGCSVVGVDISDDDIAIARTKITDALVLDITRPDISALIGTFDIVLFADVLEHLAEPRDTMRSVRSVLNPGGSIVYSIPHMGHLSVRLDLLEGRFPYTELGLLDRTHLHYYDRLEIHDIFASGGFAIAEEDPVLHGYPKRWIEERLGALGLTPAPSFFEMLHKTDADVYQFIGRAVPSEEIPPLPRAVTPHHTPPDELLEHANRVLAENEQLRGELQVTKADLVAVRQRIARVRRNPIAAIGREIRRRFSRR